MILCAKCKKKPDHVIEKMCVLYYRYDVKVRCHGETEVRSLSSEELSAPADILFFSPDAAMPLEKKAKRKVGTGT